MEYRAQCAYCSKIVDARMTPKRRDVVLHRHACTRGLSRFSTYQSRGMYKEGTLVAKVAK